MDEDGPPISAEDCIELALALDDEVRLQLLQAWHENKWRKVQKIVDEFG